MLIRSTDGGEYKYGFGDKVLRVGPEPREFTSDEAKCILKGAFAQRVTKNVEVVEERKARRPTRADKVEQAEPGDVAEAAGEEQAE